jgi:hypothetical protein
VGGWEFKEQPTGNQEGGWIGSTGKRIEEAGMDVVPAKIFGDIPNRVFRRLLLHYSMIDVSLDT